MFGIPIWVFIIFFLILSIGIKRCFTRVMPIKNIAIIPIIFLIFGIKSVNDLFGLNELIVVYLLTGGTIGMYLGYMQVKYKTILSDKKQLLIQVPGDFSLLISLLLVFLLEFMIHYLVDAHFSIAESIIFKIISVLISGVVVGLTIGRTITYFYKFIISEHCTLDLN